MQHETQQLEYRSVPSTERVRARIWLSHMLTAAALCVMAILVDKQLRYDAGETRRVAQIEVALTVYGSVCAIVSMVRGALRRRDKPAVAACVLVFLLTAYVGSLMPRAIHN